MARLLHSKNCTFYPFVDVPAGGDVYDNAIPLKWLNTFETSYEQTGLEWLGDGTFEEKSSKLDYIGVTLTFSTSMAIETLAKLTGLEVNKNGQVLTTPTSIAIRGALLWEDVYSDGKNERLGLYNVSLTLTDVPRETDGDGSDALYTFEGSAIPYKVPNDPLYGAYAGKELIQTQLSQRHIDIMVDPDKTTAQDLFDTWFEDANLSLLPQ